MGGLGRGAAGQSYGRSVRRTVRRRPGDRRLLARVIGHEQICQLPVGGDGVTVELRHDVTGGDPCFLGRRTADHIAYVKAAGSGRDFGQFRSPSRTPSPESPSRTRSSSFRSG